MKKYLNDLILEGKVELKDKVIVVESKNFTYPEISEGLHGFKVSKDGEDFLIKPLVYDAESNDYVEADAPVVFTSGEDIFFYSKRALAPYLDKIANQIKLAEGQDLSIQVLAAFDAWAKSEFSMGVYNILLTDEAFMEVEETASTTTSTTTPKPTTTTTTTTVNQG